MSKVFIIGSGLAAISAIKILIKKGIKPIILDYGLDLDDNRKDLKKKISNKKINNCDLDEINHLTFNSTLNNKFPRKTYMGSDYFYMDNNEYINYQFKKSNIQYPPASSLALGGLSNGWGSAIMPISFNDKDKLPYNIQELKKYYNLAVNEIKFSSIYDRKQNFFENFKMPDNSLNYTRDIEKIFETLKENSQQEKNIYFGSSNLLTNLDPENGCKKCGQCMSGCFYDYIYKPKQDLEKLIDEKKIFYEKNIFVDNYIEKDNKIIINAFDNIKKKKVSYSCDKLIVAAGAVNSTLIFSKSNKLEKYKFKLLSKNGFVSPIFTTKLNFDNWPNRITLPIMNYVKFSENGSEFFSQFSKINELIIKKLGGNNLQHSFISGIVSKYFLISHCNLSSFDSDFYELEIEKKKKTEIKIEKIENLNKINKLKENIFELKNFLKKSNLFLLDFIKIETESQHNGCTLPMRISLKNPNDIDLEGNSKYSKNIYYVDSASLPFLPSTPIGLPIMAHSMRIVDRITF